MKILITGGAGFIGSHLADALVAKGHAVTVWDNLSTGRKENLNPQARFKKIDLRCFKQVRKLILKENFEVIFHLAAQMNIRKSVKDPLEDSRNNGLATLNLLEAIIVAQTEARKETQKRAQTEVRNFFNKPDRKKKNQIKQFKKFIFASSGGAVYGDKVKHPTSETAKARPISPYGIDKLSIENYLSYYQQFFGLDYVALRYANIYGPRQNPAGEAGVVGIFFEKMLKKETPVINGDGKQTRDYLYIDDLIQAHLLILENLEKTKGIYNLGSGKETDLNSLFGKMNKLSKAGFKAAYAPAQKGEQKRSCLDVKKAAEDLGWKPKTNLDKGLEKTKAWYNKNKSTVCRQQSGPRKRKKNYGWRELLSLSKVA